MNEVVDLQQYDTRLDDIRKRRERTANALREGFQADMKHMHNFAEHALDYAKDILRLGHADIAKELEQFDRFINDISLAVGVLKHAQLRRAETETAFWQAAE
jgi:hypothetical protein